MSTAPPDVFVVEKKDGIDFATINRPDRLNTLNPELVGALTGYFTGLKTEDKTRVVVLRGEGRAFCAGAELDSSLFDTQGAGAVQRGMRVQRSVAAITMAMRECPQPIIALLKGPVCGGGFSIALAADVRLATPDARMNVANLKVGLGGGDMGSSYFLPRLIGWSAASALLLTGDFLHAERAHQLGLVAEIAEDDALRDAGEAWARRMLRASPLGLRLTKQNLNQTIDVGSLAAAMAIEDQQQVLCLLTEDHREALAAFFEKRDPQYHNR